jgi:hypothetical protein
LHHDAVAAVPFFRSKMCRTWSMSCIHLTTS